MHRSLRNMTTISEPLLNIHLSMDKTAAREGSGFHVEQNPPENARVARENEVQRATLRDMLTFVQQEYYDIHGQTDDLEGASRRFVEALTRRTAALVAKWQTVGFCHGVLNTDNMSIVGDTLDYGPYGFMEYFDPGHICNTSDTSGRYAFENQPEICKWNCHMLVTQLSVLFPDNVLDDFHALVDATYDTTYAAEWRSSMDQKLGLPPQDPDTNAALVATFWTTLTDTHADFTCVFRALSGLSVFDDSTVKNVLESLVKVSHSLAQKQRAAQPSVSPAQLAHLQQLLVSKPNVALRYGFNQDTLDGLSKQLTDYAAFLEANHTPDRFKRMQEDRWRIWLEQYRQHLAHHTDDAQADVARRRAMNQVNPKYILRNHVAQAAIDAASVGDTTTVAHILHLLTHPFDDGNACDTAIYGQPSDPTAPPLLVSCSS
ncbi:hypothetical protein DYB32_001296 [Aphanomyces invadans]|uniref:Selenoprotein O n=1 Tax=Aphanomyces invadans TaxID=157072 RepID=A0A3R6YFM1_9STRA|nr:hypothetical protein DYB32_001296 [Aphanomyces invadans]